MKVEAAAVNAQLEPAKTRRDDLARLASGKAASQFQPQDANKQVDLLSAQFDASSARVESASLALNSTIDGEHTSVAQFEAQLDHELTNDLAMRGHVQPFRLVSVHKRRVLCWLCKQLRFVEVVWEIGWVGEGWNRRGKAFGRKHAPAERSTLNVAARLRRWSASGRLEAGEEYEVVSHDRGPDVGLEVVETAPGAARQAVSALET